MVMDLAFLRSLEKKNISDRSFWAFEQPAKKTWMWKQCQWVVSYFNKPAGGSCCDAGLGLFAFTWHSFVFYLVDLGCEESKNLYIIILVCLFVCLSITLCLCPHSPPSPCHVPPSPLMSRFLLILWLCHIFY